MLVLKDLFKPKPKLDAYVTPDGVGYAPLRDVLQAVLAPEAYRRFRDDAGQIGAGNPLMSVLPSSSIAMPDFASFAAELPRFQEIVRWSLYSYKTYAAAGHTELQLYDQPDGQATNGRADTNMKAGGTLPGNEMFVAVSIGVVPFPSGTDVFITNAVAGTALRQWYDVLSLNCWLELYVADKEYLVLAPLMAAPPGFGLGNAYTATAVAATTQNAGLVQSGSPDNKAIYHLDPPLGILPTRAIKALLKWRAAVTVATAGRLGVMMHGWKLRAVQ